MKLRHAADRRTVAVSFGLGLTLCAPFFYRPAPWALPLHFLLSALAAFIACIITHNHVHAPVFARRGANRLFGLFLSLLKGHTTWTIYVPHVVNHHQHHGGPQDWIRVEHAGTAAGPARIVRFVLRASLCMQVSRRKPGAPRLRRALQRSHRQERLAVFALALTALALDPARALFFLILPWLTGIFALVAVNLFQHEDCANDGGPRTARNFTGRAANWLLFNNGYHAAHHLDPRRHWSELPVLHRERVAPFAPDLCETSLAAYLLSRYAALHESPSRFKVSP